MQQDMDAPGFMPLRLLEHLGCMEPLVGGNGFTLWGIAVAHDQNVVASPKGVLEDGLWAAAERPAAQRKTHPPARRFTS